MAMITVGVKIDCTTKTRLTSAAKKLDRSPHWLMKNAIVLLIERVESGANIEDLVEAADLHEDTQRNSVSLRKETYS